MLDIAGLLLLLFSLALTLAIVVPFTGILVRYRANYNPKGLQLDAEGGAQPYTGPIIKSYFTMLLRVYRIEVHRFTPCLGLLIHSTSSQGVQGFYKGLSEYFNFWRRNISLIVR